MPPVKKEAAKKEPVKKSTSKPVEKKVTEKKTATKVATKKTTTVKDNLAKLIKTTVLIDFVESQNGEWGHDEWISLCKIIAENYAPIDFDQVGLALEGKKAEFHAKKK